MANYIDNNKFEELIHSYSNGDLTVQDELFENFGLLIDRLMSGYAFKVDKEEAKQECFLLILKILKNFKKEKGKIQSYTDYKMGIYSPSSADIDPE
mgnify:CR=1 FL=1